MLKRFSVTGFKNFKDTCTIDFSLTRDYDFNKSLIKDGLVNKALLYGKNGSGKSNLGFAIMDITSHLTDNAYDPRHYLFALNGDAAKSTIQFQYVFLFNGDEIIYDYKKDEKLALLEEEIRVNGSLVFSYDYTTNRLSSGLAEIDSMNKEALRKRNLNNSVLKTVYGFSAHLPDDSPIKRIYEFADGMLWFRSLGNYEFMGSTNIIENVEQYIASSPSTVKAFSEFLTECGLHFDLRVISDVMGKRLYAKFENQSYPFFQIASTGTRSLCLFFYWTEKMKDKITFLFLDEFDAFYHFNLAKGILMRVNSNPSYQSIITTHNPYLADNAIMRPDTYLYLKDGKVKSFADSTNRVIRQGNSLEKMVLSDEL